jgi:hypothetical protein
MRNDARPVGEDAHDESPIPEPRPARDSRDSVTHDRQSHVVNQAAEDEAPRRDSDADPVMPGGEPTLNTKI